MNVSSRLLVLTVVGLAAAVFGFLLTLDLWDLGTVVVNGTRFGQNTDNYIFLGKVLLCVGITLAAVSSLMWARREPDREEVGNRELPTRLEA